MGDEWLGDTVCQKKQGGSKAEEGGEWQKGEKAASRSYVSHPSMPIFGHNFLAQL